MRDPQSSPDATGSSRSARALQDLPLGRFTGYAIVGMMLIYATSIGVRTAFGMYPWRLYFTDLLYCAIGMSLILGTQSVLFRAALRRGASLPRALVWSYLGCVAMVSVTSVLSFVLLRKLFDGSVIGEHGAPRTVSYYLATAVTDSTIAVLMWSAMVLYPASQQAQERREAEIETLRRESELLRLRANLEPHFVLNTLNTIAAMAGDEPREARRLIGILGDLFRDAADEHAAQEHTLEREVEWLKRYTAILESRHRSQLDVQWDIANDTRMRLIPRLLLQPLIENAVSHGALRADNVGRVSVRTWLEYDVLCCEVRDNGPGFADRPRRKGAKGLQIVERRLALFHPQAIMRSTNDHGAVITLRIPNQTLRLAA